MANIGDRVLIADGYWKEKILNGSFSPVFGTVDNQYQSEDRSTHGSPYYDKITVVKGDDGRTYTDDREQHYSSDWRDTPEFFTADQFSSVVRNAVQKQKETIVEANHAIKKLDAVPSSLNFCANVNNIEGPIFLFKHDRSGERGGNYFDGGDPYRETWFEYYSFFPDGKSMHEKQIIEETPPRQFSAKARERENAFYSEFAQKHVGHKIIVLPVHIPLYDRIEPMRKAIRYYEKTHRALKIIPAYTASKENAPLSDKIRDAAKQALSQHITAQPEDVECDEAEL